MSDNTSRQKKAAPTAKSAAAKKPASQKASAAKAPAQKAKAATAKAPVQRAKAATAKQPQPTVKNAVFNWELMLFLVSVFQVLSFLPLVFAEGETDFALLYVFSGYILAQWLYLAIMQTITKRSDFSLEIIAFFLSGIGVAVCGSIDNDYALKQVISIALGVVTFTVLSWIIRSTDRAMLLRMPAAVAAMGLLAVNVVLGDDVNGAKNWLDLGVASVQPSEFVKIAFIFVGAATLEKLQATRSLTKYVLFSLGCVGTLFLIRDFGTALIFFFTFIIIAFMRSGDIRTIILLCTAALMGAILILYFKPYVATRFATYRHIWDYINDKGFQQTRALIYGASGGLFGLGAGNGKMRTVFAASTDFVFGLICEEWGLLLAVLIVLSFAAVAVYAVRGARRASSTFYSIAAVSAAGLLLFQLSLNVFGVNDLLPLTGVTIPFVSRGGSSMICSWGMFAYIKSVSFNIDDTKPYKRLK